MEKYEPNREEFLIFFSGLTKTQKEIVIKKCEGKTDEEIALEYGVKKHTVRKHISNACAGLFISDPMKIRNSGNRETLIRLGMMYLFEK